MVPKTNDTAEDVNPLVRVSMTSRCAKVITGTASSAAARTSGALSDWDITMDYRHVKLCEQSH